MARYPAYIKKPLRRFERDFGSELRLEPEYELPQPTEEIEPAAELHPDITAPQPTPGVPAAQFTRVLQMRRELKKNTDKANLKKNSSSKKR